MTTPKQIVVAITGASGAIYAKRLIQLLLASQIQTHLIVSPLGQRLLHDELGIEGINLAALAGADDSSQNQQTPALLRLHPYRDVGAVLASGSFRHDGMVIVPCSSNTLSATAHGSQNNLVHRAAAVTLKERRKLILVHREMPLSLIDIENMQKVTLAGGIICPASPGFYFLPKCIDDLVDFVVSRLLDLLDVPHDLKLRWGQSQMDCSSQTSSLQPKPQ